MPRIVHDPELDFSDLEPVEIEFELFGESYLLREATADAAVKYRNAIARSASFSDGKVTAVTNIANIEPLLVSLCVFKLGKPDANGNRAITPLTETTVRNWPSRLLAPLYKRIKEISELDDPVTRESLEKIIEDAQAKLAELDAQEEKEDPLKNGQSDTLDGSAIAAN